MGTLEAIGFKTNAGKFIDMNISAQWGS
jgi:hypothetical protein